MFSNDRITQESAHCFHAETICQNEKRAEEIRAAFIGPVRQISMFADLYCESNRLILEAADQDTLLRIMNVLNHSVETF